MGFFSIGRVAPAESKVTLAGRCWTTAKLQGSLDITALLQRRSGEQTALLSAEHNLVVRAAPAAEVGACRWFVWCQTLPQKQCSHKERKIITKRKKKRC